MYEVSSVDKAAEAAGGSSNSTGAIHWVDARGMPQGGWQGGRGWQLDGVRNESHHSTGLIKPSPPFYLENIFEELDAPDEVLLLVRLKYVQGSVRLCN